jgi:hypothetical protein
VAKAYRTRESFSCDIGGITYVFGVGQIVTDDHPAFKGREGLFESLDDYAAALATSTASETASAAPGERRVRGSAGNKPRGGRRAKSDVADPETASAGDASDEAQPTSDDQGDED